MDGGRPGGWHPHCFRAGHGQEVPWGSLRRPPFRPAPGRWAVFLGELAVEGAPELPLQQPLSVPEDELRGDGVALLRDGGEAHPLDAADDGGSLAFLVELDLFNLVIGDGQIPLVLTLPARLLEILTALGDDVAGGDAVVLPAHTLVETFHHWAEGLQVGLLLRVGAAPREGEREEQSKQANHPGEGSTHS